MRYRITFSKNQAMRFTSHLDLFSTLERTMRRANLPLVYSQGFTPRPKISLASALPLGYTSECEQAEFWLREELPPKDVAAEIIKASPPGITLHKTEITPLKAPKLQNILTSAAFRVTVLNLHPNLEENMQALMDTRSLPREKIRKGKKRTYDLRLLILESEVLPPDEEGRQQLSLHLQAKPGATGRPDEVLEELGIDPLACLIHRAALHFVVSL
jgi:radical SAM-linked protein